MNSVGGSLALLAGKLRLLFTVREVLLLSPSSFSLPFVVVLLQYWKIIAVLVLCSTPTGSYSVVNASPSLNRVEYIDFPYVLSACNLFQSPLLSSQLFLELLVHLLAARAVFWSIAWEPMLGNVSMNH